MDAIWNDPTLTARFWSKVDRQGDAECWPWLGGHVRGRGQFYVLGKWSLAPRISLVLANRSWPPAKMFACHTCDNPSCVNPAHLWWGTNTENTRDAFAKGRFARATCKRGHSLPPDNPTGRGGACKICRHASKMRWQRERRAQARMLSAEHASAVCAAETPESTPSKAEG